MAKVLGKGLEALIKSYNSDLDSQSTISDLDINKIIPNNNQPRQQFNPKAMESLINSIKEQGILQPLAVRKVNQNSYELIAGERRLRASKKIGLKTVPVHVITINNESEMMELALIENIQRDDLNAMEEAEGYAILSGKYNFTQEQIAQKVSKSRPEIANKLRLLKLPPVVQKSLKNNEINYGHARALLSFRESKVILKLFKKIISKKLNVRQTELAVKSIKNGSKIVLPSKKYNKTEQRLSKYLRTKVSIKLKANDSGKIIIDFASPDELESIISVIMKDCDG
jgi:ParB family transcriptional regulator, chromosome partitioning protein